MIFENNNHLEHEQSIKSENILEMDDECINPINFLKL